MALAGVADTASAAESPDVAAVRPQGGNPLVKQEAEALTTRAFAVIEAENNGPSGEAILRARDDLRRAVVLWEQLGDQRQIGRCLHGIAETSATVNDYEAAAAAAAAAIDIAETTGDRELLALALGDLAIVRLEQGENQAAEPIFRRAADLAEEQGLDSQRHTMLHNLASSYSVRNAYQDALDTHQEALAMAREAGLADKELSSLIAIAAVHFKLGDADRAGRRLQEAVAVADEHGDRRREAWALRELGAVQVEQELFDEARASYQRSFEIRRDLGDRRGAAIVVNQLATLERTLGNPERALDLYREANTIARELEDPLGVAVTLGNIARALLETARPAEAHAALNDSLVIYDDLGLARNQVAALRSMAEASLALGLPLRAREEAGTALDLLEEIRGELADPDLRARYVAPRREVYVILAESLIALSQNDPTVRTSEEVFATSERAHARTLLELVKGSAPNDVIGADRELEARREAVLDELSSVQRMLLSPEADPARLSELETLRRELDDDRRDIEASLRRRWARAREAAPDLDRLQDRLGNDAALVEYLVGDRATVLVVVSDGGVSTHLLPGAERMKDLVEPLLELLERPGRRDRVRLQRSAAAVGELLLGPARSQLQGRDRLIVVPDGVLHLLPFEMLRLGGDPGAVIDRWSVSYVPSVAFLEVLGHHHGPYEDTRSLFAVADPTLNRGSGNPVDPGTEAGAPVLRQLADGRSVDDLAPLPGARSEAAAVAGFFPPDRTVTLVGDDASEEKVLAHPMLGRASNLHFATHAVASSDLPEHSGLVLGSTAGGDGLLQAFEVFDLSLNADLVVLSGCDTALGPELSGEGMMGLTRAFLYAGADAVVISLWPVEDRATRELMTGFYRRLEHADPATALRDAKLELARKPEFDHPFYWAPFILVGELEPSRAPER